MQKSIDVPNLKAFRESVDRLGKNRNSTIIKTLYLTASRCNEFLTKVSPSDVSYTEPLGKLVTHDIKDVIVPNVQYNDKDQWIASIQSKRYIGQQPPSPDLIRILVLKIPVLKQRKPKDPEKEKPQRYKIVALPTIYDFEPWTYDLLLYINDHGQLCFDLTRQSVYKIIKRLLGYHPQHLRHVRVTHLVENYRFTGEQLSEVTGWTKRSGYGMIGQTASPLVDVYLHSTWKNYITKLLVPLDVVKRSARCAQ